MELVVSITEVLRARRTDEAQYSGAWEREKIIASRAD